MTGEPMHLLDEDSISDADFARIARLVREMTGIDLQPHKRAMVAARLAKRLRATGIATAAKYCDQLENGSAGEETSHFVNAYTTNMTRFNREEHHFEQLVAETLPPLIERAMKGGRVRIWSAGCSSGEEPYGLAFHILDLCPRAPELDIKILASDIDLDILERARTGVYPASAADNLPSEQVKAYLAVTENGDLSVTPSARDLVAFRHLNLHGDWPFSGKFDVIICRNVAIYFDQPTQSTLWRRFGEVLCDDGHLFIGHSEGIDPANTDRFTPAGRGVFRNALKQNTLTEFGSAFKTGTAK